MATASLRIRRILAVGLEGLALDDADGRDLSPRLRTDEIEGLLLDDGVEILVEAEVVGRDGLVLSQTGHVEELHLRRVVLLAPAGRP